jgi:hypothetical protein
MFGNLSFGISLVHIELPISRSFITDFSKFISPFSIFYINWFFPLKFSFLRIIVFPMLVWRFYLNGDY